jgi:hypothetical protein
LGRARRVITSSGCANLQDPAIVAELLSKHPQARLAIDALFLDEQDFPRVKIDVSELTKVLEKLDPLTAQGVSEKEPVSGSKGTSADPRKNESSIWSVSRSKQNENPIWSASRS